MMAKAGYPRQTSTISISTIDVEYRELNKHIRECWKYISGLLRNFLFLQIILISLVFLGGNVVRIGGANISLTSDQRAAQTAAAPQVEKPPSVLSSERSEAKSEATKLREFAVLWLVFIGIVTSIGATVQNLRLCWNATNFIRRAAFLETQAEFCPFDSEERGLPPNLYLKQKIFLAGKWLDLLKALLTFTYFIFLPLWGYYGYTAFHTTS